MKDVLKGDEKISDVKSDLKTPLSQSILTKEKDLTTATKEKEEEKKP